MTIRTSRFPLDGPINLSIRAGHGSVVVQTVDDLLEAVVELRPGRGAQELVDRTTVKLAGPTLAVHAPRQGGVVDLISQWHPHSTDGVETVVTVPTGTALKIVTFTASIAMTGRCGGADLASGTGVMRLDEVDGDLRLRFGHGESSVRRVTGSVVVRSGAGDVSFGEVLGNLQSVCGSGVLDADRVLGAVRSRSGSGEATLRCVRGDVDLASGSGTMAIGLPEGVSARVDLDAGSGQVHSDLPVEGTPVAGASISIRVRTGSGDVRLFRAVA